MTRECPVCESPHDTWQGVAMHMCKMQDAEHAHVDTQEGALTWLAREGHMSGDTSADPVEDDTRADTSANDGGTTLEVPAPDDDHTPQQDAPTTDPDPECPGCGRTPDDPAVYDSAQYLEAAGDQLPTATADAIGRHDYVCTNDWKGIDA